MITAAELNNYILNQDTPLWYFIAGIVTQFNFKVKCTLDYGTKCKITNIYIRPRLIRTPLILSSKYSNFSSGHRYTENLTKFVSEFEGKSSHILLQIKRADCIGCICNCDQNKCRIDFQFVMNNPKIWMIQNRIKFTWNIFNFFCTWKMQKKMHSPCCTTCYPIY